jgi:peroxiredoxin
MKTLILSTLLIILVGSVSTISAQSTGLEIGNIAPEIKLPNLRGDTVALSTLKGKLVLVDFWATWCAPCVEEQTELARLYAKYKNLSFTNGKGFDIYGVSLDAKKPAWENFVTKKSIAWIQVSDLKFWRSPVAKTYDIQALPFNLLVNGNRVILAKNLHGAELEKIIKQLITR